MTLRVYAVDRGGLMPQANFDELCRLLGPPVYGTDPEVVHFYVDTSNKDFDEVNELFALAMQETLGRAVSSIEFEATPCQFCRKPTMPRTWECGGYTLGYCKRRKEVLGLTGS